MPTTAYLLTQAAVVYYVPMAVMVWMYVLMMKALRDMDRKWNDYSVTKSRTGPTENESIADTCDNLGSWEEECKISDSVGEVNEMTKAKDRANKGKAEKTGKGKAARDGARMTSAQPSTKTGLENAGYVSDPSGLTVDIVQEPDTSAVDTTTPGVFSMTCRHQKNGQNSDGTGTTSHQDQNQTNRVEAVTPTKSSKPPDQQSIITSLRAEEEKARGPLCA